MSASISVQYAARVAAGKIERDEAQEAIVAKLAELEGRLAERRLARKSSSLGWLFGARAAEPIKGLYLGSRRSRSLPRRSRRRSGSFASTNSTSPTSPTP